MSNSSETSKIFLVRRLLERIPVYKRVPATILDVASASFDSLHHAVTFITEIGNPRYPITKHLLKISV